MSEQRIAALESEVGAIKAFVNGDNNAPGMLARIYLVEQSVNATNQRLSRIEKLLYLLLAIALGAGGYGLGPDLLKKAVAKDKSTPIVEQVIPGTSPIEGVD